MSLGGIRTVKKMSPGTVSGQSRVAQPIAFPRPRRKRHPSALFVPGLRGWYDTSDLSTITVGGAFGANRPTEFRDKSGRGCHLTPKVVPSGFGGNSAPLTNTDTKNGLNVLTFNTGGHFMDYLSHRDRSQFNFMHGGFGTTVYLVAYNTDLSNPFSRDFLGTTLLNLGSFQDGDTGYQLRAESNIFTGVSNARFQIINESQGGPELNIFMSTEGGPGGDWLPASAPWQIYVVTGDPTKPASGITGPRGQIYVNGSDESSPSAGGGDAPNPLTRDSAAWFSIGVADLGNIVLGSPTSPPTIDGNWTSGGLSGWRFAEARIFEGVHHDYQRHDIRDELNDKWAVY